MTATSVRPRGRRPGNDDTRGIIARSAGQLFDESGYDGTSMRAIARLAEVDPALVHHYFSTKAQLFTHVELPCCPDLAERIVESALPLDDESGLRAAQTLLTTWTTCHETLASFLSTTAGDPRRRLLCEYLAREAFTPLASQAGHSNALLRAQMAASACVGVLAGREQDNMTALMALSIRRMITPLGHMLQAALVDEW